MSDTAQVLRITLYPVRRPKTPGLFGIFDRTLRQKASQDHPPLWAIRSAGCSGHRKRALGKGFQPNPLLAEAVR